MNKVLVNEETGSGVVVDSVQKIVGVARLVGKKVVSTTPLRTTSYVCRLANGTYEERTVLGRRVLRVPLTVSWVTRG
jgi:hypothetical protein